MSSTYRDKLNNNSSIKKKKSLSSSLEAVDAVPSTPKISVLKSGGIALKEELTRKLSEGKTGESETVKPSLTKPKAKSDLPFLINATQGDPHYYDEIVDFEAIYENEELTPSSGGSARNSASSGSTNADPNQKRGGVHEKNGGQNLNLTETVSHPDNGLYESVESLDEVNPNLRGNNNNDSHLTKEVKNKQNSDIRKSADSSRKSGQSSKSECNNKSISKDFTNCDWERSQSLSISNPNSLSQPVGVSVQKQQSEVELCRKLSIDSESSCVTDSRESVSDGKPGKRKTKKSIGSFFQKMFHRDKTKKSKDKSPTGNQSLIITGPIDLRGLHSDSPLNSENNLPVDEARKNSLTKSNKSSTSQSGNPGVKSGSGHSQVVDELKVKVDRINHALPLTSIADHILSKASQQGAEDGDEARNNLQITKKSSNVQRSSTFTNNGRPTVPKKPKHLASSSSPTDEETDPGSDSLVVYRKKNNSQSEEFQKKLAKFNRLSERLSSTFEAALNPTPTLYPTVGAIGRSRSFNFQKRKTGEVLPPLPPKMKNCSPIAERNCYDYPSNNRPVPPVKKVKGAGTKKKESKKDSKVSNSESNPPTQNLDEVESNPQSLFNFVRSLQKKNSAPDILFSSPGDSERNSKEEEVDNVFEELQLSPPPPIPPKTNSNSQLASPSMAQKNISSPVNNETPNYQVPLSSLPVVNKVEVKTASILDGKSSPTKENQAIQPKIDYSSSNKSVVTHTYQNAPSEPQNVTKQSISSKALPGQKLLASDKSQNQDKTNPPFPNVPKVGIPKMKDTPPNSGSDRVYQNLKFATVNTLVQEYETVL